MKTLNSAESVGSEKIFTFFGNRIPAPFMQMDDSSVAFSVSKVPIITRIY